VYNRHWSSLSEDLRPPHLCRPIGPSRVRQRDVGLFRHIPLYGPLGFVVPLVLAFFYTWLYNRTQSVLLCILLHASFTAAQDHLLLSTDSRMVDAVLLGTYIVVAAALIVATRGRLGIPMTKRRQIENREAVS
jgi:uncharacterized membrane protein